MEINKRILETIEGKQIKVKEMDKLKKAIVISNLLKKKKKRFRKQRKVSTASSKLVPLHSWLGSETESTGDDSGEDTEILSSDSECELGKDLPGKRLSKIPSKNVVEIKESTERKEGHSPSIEVSDDKENT